MATRRHFLKLGAAAGFAPAVVSAQGRARVVVIGGGFIGLEVAATARKKGLSVTVL